MIKISIIIPTCNRSQMLSDCLESLEVSIKKSNCIRPEIIVTDDSTNDDTRNLLEYNFESVQWTAGPKNGPAGNRNNGATNAAGEWLIFIDDDCVPQANWYQSYVNAIENSNSHVLEGRTDADRDQQRYDEEAPINLSGDKLWSCNFGIKRVLFFQIGGFDETFPYAAMEDIDFYNRVKLKTTILFVPDAVVHHPWRRVKPFANFSKHLNSHKHYIKKNQQVVTLSFRWKRFKIFIGTILFGIVELRKYSFRGWKLYLEKSLLNLCLIFI